jgi:hypothetical protein
MGGWRKRSGRNRPQRLARGVVDLGARPKIFFLPRGSAQAFEKVQFRKGKTRKSKLFSLIDFARAWLDFAGFGKIWIRLGS